MSFRNLFINLSIKWVLPVVEVFVAHFWSAVLWHSFMRFTTLSAMFSTQIAAGDP